MYLSAQFRLQSPKTMICLIAHYYGRLGKKLNSYLVTRFALRDSSLQSLGNQKKDNPLSFSSAYPSQY